jgi:hypothetical protein
MFVFLTIKAKILAIYNRFLAIKAKILSIYDRISTAINLIIDSSPVLQAIIKVLKIIKTVVEHVLAVISVIYLLEEFGYDWYYFYFIFFRPCSEFLASLAVIDFIALFFILYALVVINSYFTLSYLGLYGTFILNFIGVFLF